MRPDVHTSPVSKEPVSMKVDRFAKVDWFAPAIGILVLLARWFTLGPMPYFADGPRIAAAARNHTYVIQPPGYWLYARLAGLFSDPAFGLSVINIVSSALGAVCFYLVCLHLADRLTARLATAAYAAVYFSWFAGVTHSSYAAELFLTPLMFLFMLRYMKVPSLGNLTGIAVSYALVTGARPSDGVFLGPLVFYFWLKYIKTWKDRMLIVGLIGVFCLCWFIPQRNALAATTKVDAGGTLWSVAKDEAPIIHGLSKLALSNIIRVAFPCVIAFWSLLPAILMRGDRSMRWLLWIWILPGLAFFTLVYISDAPYMCYLTPAVILLAVTARPSRFTYAGLAVCFLFNLLFYCGAKPVDTTRSTLVAIYSVSGARYCNWAVQHQWYRRLNTYTLR